MQITILLWQICLSVCLSVRLSIALTYIEPADSEAEGPYGSDVCYFYFGTNECTYRQIHSTMY